jgi:diguanylate cyclase (GGDEF)-like protein
MPGLLSRLTQRPHRTPRPVSNARQAPGHDPEQLPAALALAREVLHAVEQFVISTPDLDTGRFLHRMRGTAAGLTPQADTATLRLYRDWTKNALGAFAHLQHQYVVDREEELWRLVDAYCAVATVGQQGDSEVLDKLRESHEKIRSLAGISDLHLARVEMETELKQAQKLMLHKAREDKERVATLTRQVARLQTQLAAVRGQANYDVLTKVYHRGALHDHLRETLATGRTCALAVLDLDDFKTINDTLGHVVGDRLLVLVAEQLSRATRSVDVVARYGGDEFCVLAPAFNAEQLAQRLAGAIARRHVRLEMEEERVCQVLLSLTVGIASSLSGDSPDTLFHRADEALLGAKRHAKGGVRLAV